MHMQAPLTTARWPGAGKACANSLLLRNQIEEQGKSMHACQVVPAVMPGSSHSWVDVFILKSRDTPPQPTQQVTLLHQCIFQLMSTLCAKLHA